MYRLWLQNQLPLFKEGIVNWWRRLSTDLVVLLQTHTITGRECAATESVSTEISLVTHRYLKSQLVDPVFGSELKGNVPVLYDVRRQEWGKAFFFSFSCSSLRTACGEENGMPLTCSELPLLESAAGRQNLQHTGWHSSEITRIIVNSSFVSLVPLETFRVVKLEADKEAVLPYSSCQWPADQNTRCRESYLLSLVRYQ